MQADTRAEEKGSRQQHTYITFAIRMQITEDRMEYCHVSLGAVLYIVALHTAFDVLDYCTPNIFQD